MGCLKTHTLPNVGAALITVADTVGTTSIERSGETEIAGAAADAMSPMALCLRVNSIELLAFPVPALGENTAESWEPFSLKSSISCTGGDRASSSVSRTQSAQMFKSSSAEARNIDPCQSSSSPLQLRSTLDQQLHSASRAVPYRDQLLPLAVTEKFTTLRPSWWAKLRDAEST